MSRPTPMLTAEARLARIRNKLPHFAEVALSLETHSLSPGIEFHCVGVGWVRQGCVEDAPPKGYDDWKAGARIGIAFALSVAAAPPSRVVVDRISGLTTDTNPTIVAAAAALALWKALAFSPPPDVLQRLEATVFASWQRPADSVPEFE